MPETPIHVAAQPMDRALQALAKATGANILFSPAAVSGLQARPVTGAWTAVQAVRMMIRGAPLSMSVERSGAIVIRPLPARRTPAPPRTPPPQAPARVARPLPPPLPEEELIVVARRREEHLLQVPVTATTLGAAELERRGYRRMDDLVQMVPQLVVSEVGASPQGGIILIRGIGVGEANPLADQAVSFNIDGMQVSRANIRRVAEVDMAQVEVLKGPQALYFGKNSPAGIIVIRTNDPGDHFEAGINGSYEFVGDEGRLDGFVSTPITDSLGVRLALYGSHMAGYFRNVYPQGNPYSPDRIRLPHNKDWGGRLTLKFDNGGPFDAKLKASRSSVRTEGGESAVQAIACPLGFSQLAPSIDNCRADKKLIRPDSGPNFGTVDPVITDRPYADQDQTLVSLEMNYKLSDALTLTSATAAK
jgi:iron complex outermembrane receptor protein